MNHSFKQAISHIPLPEKFTYPFLYTPHPLCVLAAEEVKAYIATRDDWKEELSGGKMFGVLVVENKTNEDKKVNGEIASNGEIGYLAAFSGNLAGKNLHPFFVPPVYDLLQPQGFFKIEEEQITEINIRIDEWENSSYYLDVKRKLAEESEQARLVLNQAKVELKITKQARELRRQSSTDLSEEEEAALMRESQHQKAELKRLERTWKTRIEETETEVRALQSKINQLKAERKERSAALQQKLFEQFRMLNAEGEEKDLYTIFKQTIQKTPPGGAGECALPKLLQYAYLYQLKPLAMAEFWWGNSPKADIRHHGYYYPSCKGKCEPILRHMLQGLTVDDNPLSINVHKDTDLEIIFEDEWLLVINKPAGMLSVPGKLEELDSVYHRVRAKYPKATGPMIVHRLDMATSGLLLIAKTKKVHQNLQAQFEHHTVKKRYIALLDGNLSSRKELKKSGNIELPLCPNPLDRPRQIVSAEQGKPAITNYEILEYTEKHTRIAFYPLTGRTHQLRVHASHPEGLNCPILGDELYGKEADRLYLHAESIKFLHPMTGETIEAQIAPDF